MSRPLDLIQGFEAGLFEESFTDTFKRTKIDTHIHTYTQTLTFKFS